MLEIKELHVQIDGKPILNGFNLTVRKGEIHAIMGPNGAGKSTLAKVIAGDPAYEITHGEILFEGQNILELALKSALCSAFSWDFSIRSRFRDF